MSIKVNSIFAGHYAGILSEVATLAVQNRIAGKAATDAAKGRSDHLADKLRDYARQTAADGVPVGDARDVLRVCLSTLADDEGKPLIPAGTVKGYGATFAGFRDALDEGVDLSTVSVKQAQERVASESAKAMQAARKALREATKPLTADGLMAVAAYAKSLTPDETGESDQPESGESADEGEPAREAVAA